MIAAALWVIVCVGGIASTASMYRHQPERHVAVVAVLGTMGWLGALALVLL